MNSDKWISIEQATKILTGEKFTIHDKIIYNKIKNKKFTYLFCATNENYDEKHNIVFLTVI